ncbi:flippase [Bacillus albus]|uniref:flippase n=1 Tax=Bacillus albus TaxID=2026189 RepID=UPI00234B101B|nr:flippase [Bacillus albus]MDC6158982.1 flippase [Bacillus albus]MDD8008459.1 flippase [Bacillus albus]
MESKLNKGIWEKVKFIKDKALKIGFVHLLSANFLLQIAGFGGQIFLTKILSVEDIGRIKVLQSFLSNLIIIAGLGLNIAILKLCSENVSQERKMGLFKAGFRISLYFSIVMTAITICLAIFNVFSSDNSINELMKYYAIQIPFLVMGAYFASYLQSQKKIHLMSKVQSISKILVVVISVIGAYLYGIDGYVLTLVLGLSLSTLLFVPFLKLELKSMKFQKINKEFMRLPLKLGSYSFATNLLGQLVITFNILILNYMNGNQAEIGYYGIAQLIITSMMIIPNTLNQMMIPYISEQTGKMTQIKGMLKRFEKRMLVMTISLCVLAFFLGSLLIPVIFGENYKSSVPYFQVLIFGVLFWSIYSPKGITLVSIGRVDINFKISMISFSINLILNLVLIKHLGTMGAALATVLTYLITIFVNRYYFKKVLDIKV